VLASNYTGLAVLAVAVLVTCLEQSTPAVAAEPMETVVRVW
jgi:hypothetical protein